MQLKDFRIKKLLLYLILKKVPAGRNIPGQSHCWKSFIKEENTSEAKRKHKNDFGKLINCLYENNLTLLPTN